MKITKTLAALPIIEVVKDCAGVMPIIEAKKTPIASVIPKPPGVIETRIERLPTEVMNKACEKPRFIPIILYVTIAPNVPITKFSRVIDKIDKTTRLFDLIECQPFAT